MDKELIYDTKFTNQTIIQSSTNPTVSPHPYLNNRPLQCDKHQSNEKWQLESKFHSINSKVTSIESEHINSSILTKLSNSGPLLNEKTDVKSQPLNSTHKNTNNSFEKQDSSSNKRKKVLTIHKKAEIIKRLLRGERMTALSKEYNLSLSTISKIKKNEENILSFISKIKNEEGCEKERKTTKSASNSKLEKAVYTWFVQRRSLGETISGPMLQAKALDFNEKLGGCSEFKASNGWLYKFKRRHGINQLEMYEEKLRPEAAAENFKTKFQKYIHEEGYISENIYNADETGLLYKSLPQKSLISRQKNFETDNDRLTILMSSNATGTHKLPLFIIGKLKKTESLKNIPYSPVYKIQSNASIDYDLFADWYKNHFIPNVKSHQEATQKKGKILLLIDHAPSHSHIHDLNLIDNDFKLFYFPSNVNVTSRIQPMEQGIIKKFKNFYRTQFLRTLFRVEENEATVLQFFKTICLRDCCQMAAHAWESLTKEDLFFAWQKLWPEIAEQDNEHTIDFGINSSEIFVLLKRIPGCRECDKDDVLDWLNSDKNDVGYHLLNEREIILENIAELNDKKDDDCTLNYSEITLEDMEKPKMKPTCKEVITAIETVLNWTAQQKECNNIQIQTLNEIRKIAEIKLKRIT